MNPASPAAPRLCPFLAAFWAVMFWHSGAFSQVEAWSARYNGPGGSADEPGAIAIDAAGNTYVTGGEDGPNWNADNPFTGHDFCTIKYDPQGNRVWVARYDSGGSDRANAVAVDSAGN